MKLDRGFGADRLLCACVEQRMIFHYELSENPLYSKLAFHAHLIQRLKCLQFFNTVSLSTECVIRSWEEKLVFGWKVLHTGTRDSRNLQSDGRIIKEKC